MSEFAPVHPEDAPLSMYELAQAVTTFGINRDSQFCPYCHRIVNEAFFKTHTPDCIVHRAAQFVADADAHAARQPGEVTPFDDEEVSA